MRQYICCTCAGDARWTTEFCRTTARDSGALAIEKRLRPGHPFGRSLPERERRTTLHLATLGLPVARLCPPDYYDAWSVICEFVGPNLRWLMLCADTGADDAAVLWQSAIAATARFARANVFVTDWALRNVAFPLTHALSGQVRLAEARFLDHAFTISAAPAADTQKGPIWMKAEQDVLAPEVRRILFAEQTEALRQVRALTGHGISRLADLADHAECESIFDRIHLGDSSLQARLRDGTLDPDRAMQHAVGREALTLLEVHGGRLSGRPGLAWLKQHEATFRKMSSPLPVDRFESLEAAGDTLAQGSRNADSLSSFALPTLDLETLIRRPAQATRPLDAGDAAAASGEATLPVELQTPSTAPERAPEPDRASTAYAASTGDARPWQRPARVRSRLCRIATVLAAASALAILSARDPMTPESASEAVAQSLIRQAGAEVRDASNPDRLPAAIRTLMLLVNDPRPSVRAVSRRRLDGLWRETQGSLMRELMSANDTAGTEFREVSTRAYAFAEAGYLPALAIEPLLRKVRQCDDHACARRAFARLRERQSVPSAAAPRSAAPTPG